MKGYDVSVYDTGRWDGNCSFADNRERWNEKVIVNFERSTESGFDSARCELPDYK